ncbi:MAG: HAD-IA family hydrolase [bacterium]|nr:HAD-IA family hydrolase [bacterium]
MLKLIIFDLDGVLVEARDMHYEALNRALAQFGYTITHDEHLSTYDALPTSKKLEMLTEHKGFPADLHEKVWQEKQQQTRALINEMAYDERMRSILRRLRDDGYGIVVCSNSVRESTKMMLLRKGLLEYVDFYLSNQDVANAKPHPEIYLAAMIKAGVRPRECLVVEDSHYGRQAAVDAGAYLCPVRDVADVTYERITEAVAEANRDANYKKFVPKWQGRDLTILIPLAGAGRQFQERGYTFPKPLVEVHGKPMIQLVVENLNTEGNFIFVVQREHYQKYHLSYLLNLIAPGCRIVQTEGITRGAAESALLASEYIENDRPLVIANSDQFLEWNSNEFFYAMAHEECDGGIVTFKSTHPRWSFARRGENGYVVEVAEKRPISDDATAGVYYYERGADFVRGARRMIERNIRTNNEFYVCPVFNELIQEGKKIRMFPIRRMYGLGTPEDLELFLKTSPT